MNHCYAPLNISITRMAGAAALFAALLAAPASAGILRFTANINAAQETTGSTSTATGSAVLVYDFETNRFDLSITLTGFANALTNSHIHEGAPGVAGGVVTGLGAEVVYTRSGNTLTGTFTNVLHTGDPATLLRGNAYLNFHTAAWPGGEIRGQLIPDVVKLTASLTAAQEVANPAVVSTAYGAAQLLYDPVANEVTTLLYVYNFTNTFSDSHIHEAPAGVNGSVRTPFGGAANYTAQGTTYTGLFEDRPWGGAPVSMINDGAYVNVHSVGAYPAGEIRGQIHVSTAPANRRLLIVSSRGQVGTGDNALITGFIITGAEPARMLVMARGPSLTSVSGALADPILRVHDSANRQIFSNDSVSAGPHQALVTAAGFAPSNASEAAVLLVLPPGIYTSVVSGVGGTSGVALSDAYEVNW